MPNIVFMGTPDFAVPILEKLHAEYGVSLVVSQPDKPVGRKRVMTPPAVAKKAEELGIGLFQPEDIRAMSAISRVSSFGPDIIITAAYGQILPPEILQLPDHGAINVHASLLPKHRGGAPIHHAIMNGDEESGISIMYMAEGLDSGDVIRQEATLITDDDNTGTLHDRLSDMGGELLLSVLPSIFAGNNTRTPQNHEERTYSPNIRKADEVIDFGRPVRDVFNHIRGLSPFPGAHTTLGGKRLKIYGAEISGRTTHKTAGTIVDRDEHGFYVACTDGVLRVTELQPSGGKRMSAFDFSNSRQDLTGKQLGGS